MWRFEPCTLTRFMHHIEYNFLKVRFAKTLKFVRWVEQSDTHQRCSCKQECFVAATDGYRFAPPILQRA
jgi:hypothetical protein